MKTKTTPTVEVPVSWVKELIKSNDVLRSCHSAAKRFGGNTNWTALTKVMEKRLRDQHEIVESAKLLTPTNDQDK